MSAALWKLFALIALLFMPFGMAPVAAAPQPAKADHCAGEHGSKPDGKAKAGSHCTAACTVVAPDPVRIAERLPMQRPELMKRLTPAREGLVPLPATPPPKRG